eukprot:455463_1
MSIDERTQLKIERYGCLAFGFCRQYYKHLPHDVMKLCFMFYYNYAIVINRRKNWIKFGQCESVPKGVLERGITNQVLGCCNPIIWLKYESEIEVSNLPKRGGNDYNIRELIQGIYYSLLKNHAQPHLAVEIIGNGKVIVKLENEQIAKMILPLLNGYEYTMRKSCHGYDYKAILTAKLKQ